VTLLGVPENRVELVYEAVDPVFRPAADAAAVRRAVRERYGLEAPFLLFVSKLYPYKGAETLIHAFALLAGGGAFAGEVVLVGSDDRGERARLEALARRLGVAPRTRFLGGLPNEEVPAVLASAELLVYPSLHETFGKPVVEAMRTGVPIVASSAGSIPEMVGDAAELVPPGDPVALAHAIEAVLSSPERRTQLVARGLKRGRDFSWERTASALVATWRAAAGRATPA
jgi:glycosyltransferase involved in cell wall biosynthesis